jgi:hypothetical protein
VTLLTVVAIALTVVVAAVTIGTFTGQEVTIGGVGSSAVTYSLDNINGPWTATLEPANASTPWFTRLEISGGDYSGPVTLTWQLEQKTTPSTWTPISGANATTTVTLSGSAENIHASSDGSTTGNQDWSADVTAAGTYRVVVTVEST